MIASNRCSLFLVGGFLQIPLSQIQRGTSLSLPQPDQPGVAGDSRLISGLQQGAVRAAAHDGDSPKTGFIGGSGLINSCCSPRKPCAGSFRRTVTAVVRDEGGLERGGRCGRASRDSAASALGTPASRPLRATAAEWPRFPAAFARAAGIGGRTVRSHSHGTLLTFASWRVAGCPARAVPRTGQRRRPCDGSDVSGELLAVGTGLPSFSRRRPSAGWAARCRGPPRQERVEKPLNERLALERLRTPRGSYR